MEPRDRRPEALTWRFRLFAISLGLVALAFVQSPGRVVTDTKLDLTVDPGGFLARALTMWDPVGAFGQVQNQAYGYLFPMGPFFWLGDAVTLEPWVIQRLWWSLLLVTAFLGMVKLAGALRIGAPWARVVAALAYALSPRILSVIGPSSIEVWPMALAPWVLVPLVIGMRKHDPRWMAALSALAVACVGGVNAVATFAVIPLGALWLLLSPASPRRRSLMIWWPVFVLLGTLWWLIPLFLLGEYSPPFLDYIESASTTTFAATLFDALRGTSDWVPYVDMNSVAGNDLIRSIGLIANGAVVVALGVVGIATRGTPHRRFLLSGVVLGLVLVTLGHTGAVDGWGADSLQRALDGLLAPLRNTHKFDLLIRIPLVLGLAHLLTVAGARARSADQARTLRVGVAVLGVAAVVGATVPAWTGQLANRGTFAEIPQYWRQASTWLAEHDTGSRAMVVPAASFGEYLWGRTGDDVLQPLAESPWAVRNVIPLAPGGNIRTLDVIEQRLAEGKGSAGLARNLERSGVRYLVVRNDLAIGTAHTDLERVYATLAGSPGITSVARFGPTLGGDPVVTSKEGDDVFVNGGWLADRPAVEVFAVGGGGGPVSEQPVGDTSVVAGGPASLLALDEYAGASGASILADDYPSDDRPSHVVLSDGARRQEQAFGRVEQNRSAALDPASPYTIDRPVHDYRVSPTEDFVSEPRLVGAKRIAASSSAGYASSSGAVVPGQQPWSAFDGDPRTSWRAGGDDASARSWLELELGGPVALDQLAVTLDPRAERNRRLVIETDDESVEVDVEPGLPVDVPLSGAGTTKVRISGQGSLLDPLAISDVSLPGLEITRPLVMPELPTSWGVPDQIVMTVDGAYRSGCLDVRGEARCVAGQEQWGEDGRSLDREVTLGADATYDATLRVAPIGGAALDAALQQGRFASASASSYLVESPGDSVLRAVDGDRGTGWVAAEDDNDPHLTLQWLGTRRVSQVRVVTDRALSASIPREVTLRFSDGTEREVALDGSGLARFRPVAASWVQVRFGDLETRRALDTAGFSRPLPVGVSEISLPSNPRLFPTTGANDRRVARCGEGPAVEIDGVTHVTRVDASATDVLAGGETFAEICGPNAIDLTEGRHRIRVLGTETFRPTALVLGDAPEPVVPTTTRPSDWGATERSVDLASDAEGERLVTVAENHNAGWQDTEGRSPVQVNGWQQGWFVGEDEKSLALSYAPATPYRVGLGAGLLTLLVLLLVVLRRGRRSFAPVAPRSAVRRPVMALVGGVVAVGLVAGFAGVVAAAVGWAVGLVVRRWSDDTPAWAAGGAVLVAAGAYVIRPWGAESGWAGELAWPQLVVLVGLGLVASCVVGGLRRPRLRNRMLGRSTTR
ncbi:MULTISPECIES: alpha-(1-_3)-arabinofuranosyltransferase [Mumia]|uniref:alpha-(1->3)-arabinofuranosyltransferase n=1 Tax=Mumia TaxID=1546255 RepID=UPI0014223281|nr:alpha-(1->3)-arabinofuranosyltransferase [Mumia sp. ZJ430]